MVFIQWLSRQSIIIQISILYPIGYMCSFFLLSIRRALDLTVFHTTREYFKHGHDPLDKRKIEIRSIFLGAALAAVFICLLYEYAHRA